MSVCAAAATLTEPPAGNIGYLLHRVSISFIVIETVFVALRAFARFKARTPWGADDFLIILALISNYAFCGVSLAMVHHGVGRHTLWLCMVYPQGLVTFAKLQIPSLIFLSLAIAFAKLAMLSLFLRIFVQPAYRVATYVLMAITIGALIAVSITAGLVCTPIAYLWEPHLHPGGKCIDVNAFWRWCNFPQVVTDVAILLLPLPALWQLNLSKRDRIGVVVTFCTGSLGLITSVVRFAIYLETDGEPDRTWVATRLGCMTVTECGIYLIAACLPGCRTLLRTVKSQVWASSVSRRGYGDSNPKDTTELASLGKPSKGFSRLGPEGRGITVSTSSRRQTESDEEFLTAPGNIMMEKDFHVTASRQ